MLLLLARHLWESETRTHRPAHCARRLVPASVSIVSIRRYLITGSGNKSDSFTYLHLVWAPESTRQYANRKVSEHSWKQSRVPRWDVKWVIASQALHRRSVHFQTRRDPQNLQGTWKLYLIPSFPKWYDPYTEYYIQSAVCPFRSVQWDTSGV